MDFTDSSGPVIGARVAALRRERGWSAQHLADRCTELGYTLPRSTVANIESGRKRDIPVQEVVVFAAALGVAPGDLAPALRSGEYEAGLRAGIAAVTEAALRLAENEEGA